MYIVLRSSIFIQGGNYSRGETIQGGTLIKGGHYRLEKGFDRRHIQGGTLFKGGH